MLRSLYVMFDYHLSAADGVQGTVQDFLFDDETWVIHYLVAHTATAVGQRKVLILPFVLGQPDWERKRLPVYLTSQQIRTSPPLEADLPISRQRETGLKQPGSHLRSMREVLGYTIHGVDGEVGTIEDFVIEDMLWGVHFVVVSLRTSARSIVMSPESFRSISWRGKSAWVNLTLDEISRFQEFDPATPVNKGTNHRVYDYYGRPVLSPAGLGAGPLPRQP